SMRSKRSEGVGIEDDGRTTCEASPCFRSRFTADAGGGTDQHGILATVIEEARNLKRISDLREHDGGEMGGVDGHRIRRRSNRDKPCPDAQGSARGEAGSTGVGGIARD